MKKLKLKIFLFSLLVFSGVAISQTNAKDLGAIKREKLIQIKNLNELITDLPSDFKTIGVEVAGRISGKVVLCHINKLELSKDVLGIFNSADLKSKIYIDAKIDGIIDNKSKLKSYVFTVVE